MAEQVSELNNEPPQIADARGRPYISPAKQAQLAQARENKKRKREEELERQQQIQSEVQGIKQTMQSLLSKVTQPVPTPAPMRQHNTNELSDDEDEELDFPPPEPKRRRLLNPHRREPVSNHIEPAGYGVWSKIGSVVGIIAFNTVVAAAIAKVRSITVANQNKPTSGDDHIDYE